MPQEPQPAPCNVPSRSSDQVQEKHGYERRAEQRKQQRAVVEELHGEVATSLKLEKERQMQHEKEVSKLGRPSSMQLADADIASIENCSESPVPRPESA